MNTKPSPPFVPRALTSILCLLAVCWVPGMGTATAQEARGRQETHRLSDPRPPGMQRGSGMRGRVHSWLETFRSEYPDRYRELMELRETNPEMFRDQLRNHMQTLVEQGRSGRHLQEEKVQDLARQWRTAETEEKHRELRSRLRKELAELFDARLESQQKRLADMKARLRKLEKTLARRKVQRDAIIETRLEDLLRDPELRWHMAPLH